MVSVFVFYDSKYGNTKVAAEKIAEGIESEGVGVEIGYVKDVGIQEAVCVDAIVLGAPNHMASPSRTMQKFITLLASSELKARKVAVFGTYAGKERTQDRAVKKLERIVDEKLSGLNLVLPGLSVHVRGVSGPVIEGELPKCVEYGKAIANQLKT
jgi:flavorubredoxin